MATQKTVEIMSRDSNERYCSIVEFLKHTGKPVSYDNCAGCRGDRICDYKLRVAKYSDRLLFQFKEIEIFAWLLGERLNRTIPFNYAADVWTKSPLADKFHEYYDTLEVNDDLDLVFGPKKRAEEAAKMSTDELVRLIDDYENMHRSKEERMYRAQEKAAERVAMVAVA